MNLQAYLDRIHFEGTPHVDVETLKRVHRQHLLQIPYENLDVQLENKSDISVEKAYDKIVGRGRGGWCYEMNGLLGWALGEIGFDMMRMTGGVMREMAGDTVLGNHLVLSTQLDGITWLVDVGFGDGQLEPTPLVPGEFSQGFLDFRLEHMDDGFWRFHNHPYGGAKSFDFRYEPTDETSLMKQCQWLQSAPESMFVQNLVCQRFRPEHITVLKGRSLAKVSASGQTKTLLESVEAFEKTLSDKFNLSFEREQIDRLWTRVLARHEELFGADDNSG
ncbi:MAG: arylamine N-acetyltransferase [Pseudomonadota bacterium]